MADKNIPHVVDLTEVEPLLTSNESTPLLAQSTEDLTIPLTSTFRQTTINSINFLMGMGLLSLPFALAKLGWIIGMSLLALFCGMACFTAHLIGKCMTVQTPTGKPTSLYDIAFMAFGLPGKYLMITVFTLELYTASVAMVILFADSVISLVPSFLPHKITIMVFAVVLMTPLALQKSMSRLSWTSFIGVLSLALLAFTIAWDGVSHTETPGSLINPAETRLWPLDWKDIGLGIGLLFVGLDGHAVFPTLYLDMSQPERYGASMKTTYSFVGAFYAAISTMGYLMFGVSVLPEVTQNLPLIPSYNPQLTQLALAFIALNPLTKFPMTLHPVNSTIELLLGVEERYVTLSRSLVVLSVLCVSILFPSFHKVMGFIGAALSFLIAVILPTSCYLKLTYKEMSLLNKLTCITVLALGVGFMIFGTVGVMLSE
ncbi:transmembrane amino acid transporter protein-domain-containing protein [Globomyces pollinis-pini]|nr:transmembrane amino acid transporter protein-domain-containing protein [Globomyces pollinis-pini]